MAWKQRLLMQQKITNVQTAQLEGTHLKTPKTLEITTLFVVNWLLAPIRQFFFLFSHQDVKDVISPSWVSPRV